MRGNKLFLLAVVFVLWSFSGYAEDIQSGDTKINQNISGPPYYQLWTFNGSQNDGVIINAVKTSGNLDTAIDLFDPDGYLEAQGWQTGYGGDVLEHQLGKTGSYTIWIKDYDLNDTGVYNLTFLKMPIPGDPNGGTIASGQTLTSRGITQISDIEGFQFQGSTGEGIIINAVKTSGDLDTAIDLFAPNGTLETRGWQTGYGGDALEYSLLQTGVYTIVIKDYGLDHTGTYNLTLLKLPIPGDQNGGAIASGQTFITRSIAHASDIEGFQFQGATGEGLIVNAVKTSGDLDTAIDLFAPNGTLETRGWQTGYGGDALEYSLLQTGVYTIVIKDYGLDHTGTYNLTFIKIPGAVSHSTDQNGGDIAPGQTINPAGTISVASDIDAFQFYGEKDVDHVIISAITISGTLDTAIDLFAPDGTLETRGWQTGYGGDTLDYWLKQAGLYTIVIKDYGLDHTGTFWISLTKFPVTLRPGIYNPSPVNGANISSLAGSFSWNAVSGATGYDLYFGENVTTALQKIGSNLTSPSRAFPALEFNKVYYWHVVAHTATGDVQGPYWWFITPVSYLLWTR